jgi:hypothetical protein
LQFGRNEAFKDAQGLGKAGKRYLNLKFKITTPAVQFNIQHSTFKITLQGPA